jgi:hypothetical protein
MAGLQSPLVLERGRPLARRAPIVRLVLNRPEPRRDLVRPLR